MARQSFRSGDCFFFEFEGGVGVGQVIYTKPDLYVVFYEGVHEKEQLSLEGVLKSQVILVGRTVDALFYHGRWVVFGNVEPVLSKVPFPWNKFVENGVVYIEDFFGAVCRVASESEAEFFTNKLTVAPIRFQKAFLAHHGLLPWEPSFEVIGVDFAKARCL